MASSPRRRHIGDLLAVYGAALATPALVMLIIPDDRSWALPIVVVGLVCLAVGLIQRRRQAQRADSTPDKEPGQADS